MLFAGTNRNHVKDLFDGSPHNEGTAEENDETVDIELSGNEFGVDRKERHLHFIDDGHENEEEHDSQGNSESNTKLADKRLPISRSPL